jgi:RNA recognition motif-containing protein
MTINGYNKKRKMTTQASENKAAIYVGDLPSSCTQVELNKLFEKFGKI